MIATPPTWIQAVHAEGTGATGLSLPAMAVSEGNCLVFSGITNNPTTPVGIPTDSSGNQWQNLYGPLLGANSFPHARGCYAPDIVEDPACVITTTAFATSKHWVIAVEIGGVGGDPGSTVSIGDDPANTTTNPHIFPVVSTSGRQPSIMLLFFGWTTAPTDPLAFDDPLVTQDPNAFSQTDPAVDAASYTHIIAYRSVTEAGDYQEVANFATNFSHPNVKAVVLLMQRELPQAFLAAAELGFPDL